MFKVPAPLNTSILDDTVLRQKEVQPLAKIEQFNDNSKEFMLDGGGTKATEDGKLTGGLGGFNVKGLMVDAPSVQGAGGVGVSDGKGTQAGKGGTHSGFGDRGKGRQQGAERDVRIGVGRYGGFELDLAASEFQRQLES